MQTIQIFHSDGAKVLRLSRSNIEKILYCFLTKASGETLLSTFIWMGDGPCPRQKFLSNIFSGINPLWTYHRPALQQNCWMTPFHGWPQSIKHLKPWLHRRLDGAHHILFCLPRSYHPTKSSAECHTHLDSTALPPSKHLTRPDLMGGHLLLLMNENFFYRFYEIDDYYPFHK